MGVFFLVNFGKQFSTSLPEKKINSRNAKCHFGIYYGGKVSADDTEQIHGAQEGMVAAQEKKLWSQKMQFHGKRFF